MTQPEMKQVIADLNSKTNEEIIAILETSKQTAYRRALGEEMDWESVTCYDSLRVLPVSDNQNGYIIAKDFIANEVDEDGKNPGADEDDYLVAWDTVSDQVLIQYKGA